MLKRYAQLLLIILLSPALLMPAVAVLKIEITRGVDDATPIAVVPFGWQGDGQPPEDVAAIISANLQRSGFFRSVPRSGLIASPYQAADVQFADWRALGVDYLVVGKVVAHADGAYQVQFQLLDVHKRSQLAGYSLQTRGPEMRSTAHQISDIIYKAVTGRDGAFDTFITYITVHRDRRNQQSYRLAIADSDGHNEQVIYESNQPVLSPKWSPDGKQLAFVSFAGGRSEIYIQNIISKETRKIASHPGLNSAPAWSPDGKRLALTLSRDGNPEIYIMELAGGNLQRITHNPAIDTEATWTPDGKSLIFTSDRGGSPQLYQVAVGAQGAVGSPRRLTFQGSYNTGAAVSPDGRYIAMVHRDQDGAFRIAVLEQDTRQFRILTDSRLDESPSFAPNSSMIIYATEQQRRGILAAVSVDGRAQQRLSVHQGEVREPAWSSFRPE